MTMDRTEVLKIAYQYKDQFISELKKVFSYQFDPSADTLLFEIHGGEGLFAVNLLAMSEGEEMHDDLFLDLLDGVNFEIDL
ncbi:MULTISPECIES: hypothetical protein [unclassified Thermoactinomyces]|jgi:hypothetical protein|uniref:hypothetical protein n=1 Tax=unclassified Thermoactinomyces TaxID=2634588 RepID=UPI0018DEBBEC|nr:MULTISPECIES: hypothetical protein [unclassified Thermoactinomyces]MBH8605838.1 hypothetical protein [Thermoactinomyces sp. CICC 10522]MBH8608825.1 hypothetical protein [Thermoactinomyces sp. CICC 10521]